MTCHWFFFFFLLSVAMMKTMTKKQLMRKRFISFYRLQSIIERSQVRNTSRAGTWSRNQVLSPPTGWLSGFGTQLGIYCLETVPFTVALVLLYELAIKKMPPQTCHRPIWRRQSPSWHSLSYLKLITEANKETLHGFGNSAENSNRENCQQWVYWSCREIHTSYTYTQLKKEVTEDTDFHLLMVHFLPLEEQKWIGRGLQSEFSRSEVMRFSFPFSNLGRERQGQREKER